MTNKIIASLMITMQLTVCMEPVTDRQIVVYRPVDQQNKISYALRVADLLLPITARLQTLGRLRSTCHLFHDLIDFSEENPTFNPGALGVLLAKNFNIANEALISCAHAQKRDVFESIFYNGTPTEQRIRGESLRLLIPGILKDPSINYINDIMAGYRGKIISFPNDNPVFVDGQPGILFWIIRNRSLNESYHEILEKALISNNYIVIQILHAVKKIDIKDAYNLYQAAEYGSFDVIKVLLDKGADVNAEFKKNKYIADIWTPLMTACKCNSPAIVNLLLEKGANSLLPDQNGSTALHLSCVYGFVECARLLLQNNGGVINAQNVEGMTPLHMAVNDKQKDAIQLLLREGANVNAQDILGNTPLHRADNEAVATLLLQHGADPNIKKKCGQTALLAHIFYAENLDIVKLLLNNPKCDLNAVDIYGNTALHYAIDYYNDSELCELLLNKGCKVNVQNYIGETPLHIAAKQGYIKHVQILLENGANPLICDNQGKSPSDYSSCPVLQEAYKNSLISCWWQRLAICAIGSMLGFVGYRATNQ